MAISTYTELQTAIEDWFIRADFTVAMLKTFISQAEHQIASDIKFRAMEKALSETLSATNQTIDYPSDALELKGALYIIEDDCRNTLTQVSEEDLKTRYEDIDSTVDGKPQYFYITPSNTVYFDVIADEDYAIKGTYYERLELTNSVTSNWILTNFPFLYLYACLSFAAVMIEDDPRRYEAMYEHQLTTARKRENRTNRASGPRRVRQQSLDGNVAGTFNRYL